jgi:hypothetical protein
MASLHTPQALTAKYAAIAIQTTAGDKFAELCGLGDEADDAELAAAEAASEAADAEAEKLTAEVVAADVLEAETKAASEQAAGIVTKIEGTHPPTSLSMLAMPCKPPHALGLVFTCPPLSPHRLVLYMHKSPSHLSISCLGFFRCRPSSIPPSCFGAAMRIKP